MNGYRPMRVLMEGRDRAGIHNFIVMLHDYKPDTPYHRFMPPMVGTAQDIEDLTNYVNAQVNPQLRRPNALCLQPENRSPLWTDEDRQPHRDERLSYVQHISTGIFGCFIPDREFFRRTDLSNSFLRFNRLPIVGVCRRGASRLVAPQHHDPPDQHCDVNRIVGIKYVVAQMDHMVVLCHSMHNRRTRDGLPDRFHRNLRQRSR